VKVAWGEGACNCSSKVSEKGKNLQRDTEQVCNYGFGGNTDCLLEVWLGEAAAWASAIGTETIMGPNGRSGAFLMWV
jgi:hypothetical protein